MNFHEAQEAVRKEDEAAADSRRMTRELGRRIILHALDNVQGSRLRRPDGPQESSDGLLSANFGLAQTMNEIIAMSGNDDGTVKIERGKFDQKEGFLPLRRAITASTIEDAMKALVRLSTD